MFKKMSLKIKLITLFLLIGLVPVMVISLLAYHSTTEQLREEAFSQMQMFGDLASHQIGEYIEGKEAELEVLASTRDVYHSLNILREIGGDFTDPRWLERQALLESLSAAALQKFGIETFLITSTDSGAIYCTDENVAAGHDFSDRDYVQGALAGNITWSEIFYSDIYQGNAQAVSMPIRSGGDSGEITGSLSLILNQAIIDEVIHSNLEELGRTADSYMIDAEGLLLSNTMQGDYVRDAALQQKIDTMAATILSNPITSGDFNFYQQGEYKNYLGRAVFGALSIIRAGNMPVGFVVEVEAARAGEQGRGFAVVASEVRNLAGRAAEAAKEIEKRIKDSIARVENGNALMNETENVLQEIVTDTEKAGDDVGEIAAALRELATAVKDIRDAIEELNQVTQQNASLVEEIASSSENMNSEAEELSKRVGFFKLAGNGHQNQREKPKKLAVVPVREKNNDLRGKTRQREPVAMLTEQGESYEFNEEDFEKF